MAKLKGLGRGLDALLAGNDDNERKEDTLGQLPVGLLRPGRYQPRSRMDPESIAELADSIKAQGLIQPILVRQIDGGRYEIIAGERRWRAAQLAGLTEVPVVIRDVPDQAALAMALIENIQREDLNPLEEARGLLRLVDEFQMTHDAAAQAVGRSRSAVSNLLRLLNLSQAVQELLMQGKLEMGHARALLAVSPARQADLAHQIITRALSVRETEQLVARGEIGTGKMPRRQKKDRDLQALEEELAQTLGAVVSIQASRGGKGKLTIGYSSLDQLDEILARLRGGA
ncbi:MAG TPA: ParB/RepB/Spo0J family partition protein [Burkholderiales bacterium]|jgi:ParB family chromosome partitioning protein|nr:ParB/RepB/Spo0J family partition protein [Burkholderiales bacterium]